MKIPKFYVLVLALLFAAVIGFVSCSGSSSFKTITVTPANTTVATGSQTSQKFTATETLDDNSMTLDMSTLVSWSSSDPNFAIDSTGNVTWGAAVSGTTTITAADTTNHVSNSITFRVADPDTITVTPAAPSISLSTGPTQQFIATARFTLPTPATVTQDLTSLCNWDSSNTGFATITLNGGLATAVATGDTIINATYPVTSKKSADVTLAVTP